MSQPTALDHDQLVQLIYDSADTPGGFMGCLESIGQHIGPDIDRGQMMVIDGSGAVTENHFYAYVDRDPSNFERYYDQWRDQDPRMNIARQNPGRVLSDVTVIDARSFECSAIYNEFLAPDATRYTLFGLLPASNDLIIAPAFMRTRPQGAFEPDEVARLTALLPHLTRAARVRHLNSALHEARDDLRLVLDAIPTALVLLDGHGRVVCASALAAQLMQPADSLRTERGVLTCARPDEARSLATALARTAALADASTRRPARTELPDMVQVSRPGASPLAVVLSPLRPLGALRERGARSARVLAIVHDPERRVRLRHDLVARLHGLTTTEAHVAVALAEGMSLAEVATARGITEQTARTHLKRILDKTGAGRQAELVRVLLTAMALHQVLLGQAQRRQDIMRQSRVSDHDQLVHRIYDSADGPDGFTQILHEVTDLVGAESGQIILIREDGVTAENHGFSYHDADVEASNALYNQQWRIHDPRFRIAAERMGQMLSDVTVLDPERFERSPIYNEFLIDAKVRYSLFGTALVGEGHILAPAFFRSRPGEAFEPGDVARVTALLPHLLRASRQRLLATHLREARDDVRHALDASPTALMLLDIQGHIVASNALAEELMQPADSLRTERGVLTCARPDEARSLAAALARTAALADASTRRPARTELPDMVQVSRPGASPLTVVLSPLRPLGALRERGARSARVLAIVHDPERRVRLRHDLVARLHGLTTTEAHVAVALAEGMSLAEVATARGITEQTARTHLKRILDKTGAGRQAELVRVLVTSLALHRVR